MPIWLLALAGGFLFLKTKKAVPTNTTPPAASAGGKPTGSAQPGVTSLLTQGLQALGFNNSAQNTNQSQYGGSKAFMGAPSSPLTTQIIGSVANNASGIWNNLFGSSTASAGTPAATDPSAVGTVSSPAVDPQPVLPAELDGSDSMNASSAFDNAPDFSSDDGG